MKTIEEKCDELFVNCSDDMSKYKSKELAVNLAEFTQRWIPVEEELPEMSDNDEDWIFDMYDEDDEDDDYDDEPIKCSVDVLITDNYGYVGIGCLHDDGNWSSDNYISTTRITHWRPIEIK